MDSLRRARSWLWDRPYILSYVLTLASVLFVYWLNGQARNERTLQLCYADVLDSEKLILVAAQDTNDPPDEADDRVLMLFRQLTKDSQPPICQPRYDEMRKRAVKTLNERLRVYLKETTTQEEARR